MIGFVPYWTARSARERSMLSLLGGLAALALGWLLIVDPLLDWRSAAEARHASALQDQGEAKLLSARLGIVAGQGGVIDADGIAAIAASAGFKAKIGDADGDISVSIASARPDRLFAWVAALETTHGLRVKTARIVRNEDATLAAELTIGGAS